MLKITLLMTIAAALTGCAELPSASKQSLLGSETTIRPQAQEVVFTSRGSLVPASQVNPAPYRGLFEDRRAVRVGLNTIRNQTGTPTSTANNRQLSLGLNNNGTTNFDSKAGSSASNQFSGTITVTVLEVLPNGNLNVGGEKRLAVGNEEEVIRFGGIVSPVNLQGNTILSSQVADARIEYRGAGITDEIKNPGWLTKLFARYSPN
jgi:flagellar L-ring protein precursor FlgH